MSFPSDRFRQDVPKQGSGPRGGARGRRGRGGPGFGPRETKEGPTVGTHGRGFSPRDGHRRFGNPALMESLGGLRQALMDVRDEDEEKVLAILEEAIAKVRALGD